MCSGMSKDDPWGRARERGARGREEEDERAPMRERLPGPRCDCSALVPRSGTPLSEGGGGCGGCGGPRALGPLVAARVCRREPAGGLSVKSDWKS